MIVRILQKFRTFVLDAKDMNTAVGTEKQEVTLVLSNTTGCLLKAAE